MIRLKKYIIAICAVALVTTINAQTPKNNSKTASQTRSDIEREPQTETDGYTWTLLSNGKYYAAEDADGSVIIPLSRQYTQIYYWKLPNADRAFFRVKKGNSVTFCDLKGRPMIPIERGYTDVIYQILEGYKYFQVMKGDKSGACDLSGKEILAPVYHLVIYSNDNFVVQRTEDGPYENTKKKLSKRDILDPNAITKTKETASDGYIYTVVYQGDYCGVENKQGKTIIPLSRKYTHVSYESSSVTKSKYFEVKQGKKIGVCDMSGAEVIAPKYYSVYYSEKNGFSGTSTPDGDSEYLNVFLDKNGKAVYKKKENTSSVAVSNSEAMRLFQQAYNMPAGKTEQQKALFLQAANADPANAEGVKATSYNNIGILCENAGDIQEAKEWYEKSLKTNPSFEVAKKNLERVKSQLTGSKIKKALNVLADLSKAALNMQQAYYQTKYGSGDAGAGYDGGGSVDMENSQVQSGLSCDEYKLQYNRMADKAKGVYESLTLLGSSRKNDRGEDEHGSTHSSMSSSNYVSMKKNLRYYQGEMKKIRAEARKSGCDISTSNYESVTVSY